MQLAFETSSILYSVVPRNSEAYLQLAQLYLKLWILLRCQRLPSLKVLRPLRQEHFERCWPLEGLDLPFDPSKSQMLHLHRRVTAILAAAVLVVVGLLLVETLVVEPQLVALLLPVLFAVSQLSSFLCVCSTIFRLHSRQQMRLGNLQYPIRR